MPFLDILKKVARRTGNTGYDENADRGSEGSCSR